MKIKISEDSFFLIRIVLPTWNFRTVKLISVK